MKNTNHSQHSGADDTNIGKPIFHILALITVSVWGVTFISTKLLIASGLTPVGIFISRFLIAYLTLLLVCHKRIFAKSLLDEFLLLSAGLCGGSLYFITENTALELTYASNVSLLICTAPLFTMLMSNLVLRKRFQWSNIIGSGVAFIGVGIVVSNDSFSFEKSLIGDILTIMAAILWAIYCMLLKLLDKRYDTFFITRKVFFYGLFSAACSLLITPSPSFEYALFLKPMVIWNLLFLGIIASFLCYIMWNNAVKNLGADKTANYIYITPLVTVLGAVIVLDEPFTWNIALGSTVIISGLWLSEHFYNFR